VGSSQQRARRIGVALRGPHRCTRPDATTSCAAGGAVLQAEKRQRPGQEAAGSRHAPGVGRQTAPAAGEPIAPQPQTVMEAVLRRENRCAALRRGQANQGAPGGDGMSVDELPDHLRPAGPEIREQLLSETSVPVDRAGDVAGLGASRRSGLFGAP
jgi:hypothetical protein